MADNQHSLQNQVGAAREEFLAIQTVFGVASPEADAAQGEYEAAIDNVATQEGPQS